MLTKQAIRTHHKQLRQTLSKEMQQKASQTICRHIHDLQAYQQAQHIGLYRAVNNEIDLQSLWQSTGLNKHHYCPHMHENHTLSFLPVTATTRWCKRAFGILEPDIENKFARNVEQLEIIFIPLVAFDKHGTRIGAGGGYYDRTLAGHSSTPLLIGVGYECLRYPFIEPEPWDIPLHAVITEQAIHWSRR